MRLKRIGEKVRSNFKLYIRYMLFILSVFLLITLGRNILRIRSSGTRVDEARLNVEKLSEENKKLQEQLEIAQSEQFVEKQLRDKLGLAKEGEVVVVLPEDEILRKFSPQIQVEEDALPDPNWRKWLNLFY